MIDFVIKENDLTGKVDLFYCGTELFYQKLIVNAERCSQLVFDESTNPLVFDFLSVKSIIELVFNNAGIYDVELFFLQLYSAQTITTNFNLLESVGIFSHFYGFNTVFIGNTEYRIIQENSTDNSLFLDRPIETSGQIWKAKRLKKSVTYLAPIKDKLVHQVLGLSKHNQQILQNINLVKLIELENDFSKKRKLFKMIDLC